MVLVLMFSLVACSTTKNNDKSQSNNTADISNLMESEPSNLDDATALYQKLMQKENEIFTSNSQLWEKVFMSANKDTPMIEDGTNYGDFLLNTIENGKDKFTADELKILKDGANQIKEIEGKLTIIKVENILRVLPSTPVNIQSTRMAKWFLPMNPRAKPPVPGGFTESRAFGRLATRTFRA